MTPESHPLHETNLSLLERIDAACDRFEARWQAVALGRLADFLEGTQGAQRSELLRHLLCVELSYRRCRGERPRLAEYLALFPDEGEAIAGAFRQGQGAAG